MATTGVTASGSHGDPEMRVAVELPVRSDHDVRRASEIVREACLTSPYVFSGP